MSNLKLPENILGICPFLVISLHCMNEGQKRLYYSGQEASYIKGSNRRKYGARFLSAKNYSNPDINN
jgi:hypothetical protein